MSNKPTLYAYAVKDRGRNQKVHLDPHRCRLAPRKGQGLHDRARGLPDRRPPGADRAQAGRRPDKPADTFEAEAAKEAA